MSQPFIFVATHKLREGKEEAAKELCAGLAQLVETKEPRMIAFNGYCNEEGTEVSIVQVHPDAESMLFHMQVLREHISGAYEEEGPVDVTTSIQLFGTPGDDALSMIKSFNEDVPVIVKPIPIGGFTRSAAQE